MICTSPSASVGVSVIPGAVQPVSGLLVHAFRDAIRQWEWQTLCCVVVTSLRVGRSRWCVHRSCHLEEWSWQACSHCFAAKIVVVVPLTVSRPSPICALCGLTSQSIMESSVRRSLHRQLSISSTNISQLFMWDCFSQFSLLNVDPHPSQWLKSLKLSCGSHFTFSRS